MRLGEKYNPNVTSGVYKMSPKGKQARKSQRKKAQLRQEAVDMNADTSMEDRNTPIKDLRSKKQPREIDLELEGQHSADIEKKSEPKIKKNSSSNQPCTEANPEDNGEVIQGNLSSKMSTVNPSNAIATGSSTNTDDSGLDHGDIQTEVNKPSHHNVPPLGQMQWAEIMSRFDSFEKTIQATIKEEIKVNTVGVQNQIKKINTTVKGIENKVSTNQSAISKINQKVARLDNLKESLASEIEKQVSQLKTDLQASKEEIDTLKSAK